MNTYGVPARTAVRGSGAVVWDEAGNCYLDMFAGIAVNVLGHAHPDVIQAVCKQVATLGHVSNLVATVPAIALAERLLAVADCGPGAVFFCNSGAEANETAVKLSRRTGRPQIVAAVGGFHGRTMGALSLTGQPDKKTPFAPLLDVTHVPYGDVVALRSTVTSETAAVVLEPIQGEAGVIVPPPGYLSAARELTSKAGALLILDEVQTGIARTGSWLACHHDNVRPDVVTLAKGLGGGLPIGATLAFGEAASLLGPGQHGTTFGGNPISCAAALAVMDVVERDDLCARARMLGQRLRDGVNALNHPLISHVRGMGALLGIVLARPIASHVENQLQDRGFWVNTVRPETIRLAPPLVMTDAQADAFVYALHVSLNYLDDLSTELRRRDAAAYPA